MRTSTTTTGLAPPIRRWVSKHPFRAFITLAYTLSWAYWIPVALGADSVRAGVGWPSQMPGLLGPAVAAVIVTSLADGTAGLADLWSRITRWRVGWWWLSVIVILLSGAVAIDVTDGFGFTADLTVTALIVALVWAPWHTPLFFVMSSFERFGPGEIVGWTVGLTAGSFVLAWLYRGSGSSILLVAVWHIAFNFTSATEAGDGVVAAVTSTLVMAAAVVIIVNDRWLRRSGQRAP